MDGRLIMRRRLIIRASRLKLRQGWGQRGGLGLNSCPAGTKPSPLFPDSSCRAFNWLALGPPAHALGTNWWVRPLPEARASKLEILKPRIQHIFHNLLYPLTREQLMGQKSIGRHALLKQQQHQLVEALEPSNSTIRRCCQTQHNKKTISITCTT